MMQHQSRLIVRTVCKNVRIKSSHSVSIPSIRAATFDCIRSLHLSRPSGAPQEPSTSTTSAAQLAENPLKIASASGDTPPPEDPEARDHDSPRPDDIPPTFPRPADAFARPAPRGRGRPRGSSSRRSLKSQRPRKPAVFKPNIPEWFMSRNVTLFNGLGQIPTEQNTGSDDPQSTIPTINSDDLPSEGTQIRIAISPYIRKELEAHLSAALLVQPGGPGDNVAARKAHIHLQCPKRGAIYFLDELVENVAKELEADIVRLDGQDLDELLENLIDPSAPEMGYSQPHIFFTNIMRDNPKDMEQKEEAAEEENEEIEEEEEPSEAEFRLPPEMPMRLFRLFAPRPLYPLVMNPSSAPFSGSPRPSSPREDTESKVSAYLDLLISAPFDKRKFLSKKSAQPAGETPSISQLFMRESRTVIYLRDVQSILETPRGQVAHQALLNVVHNRRRLGEKIVLVVSDDLSSDNTSASAFSNQYYHFIRIPPPTTDAEKAALQEDKDSRTREINLRSIQSAIRQRSRTPSMEFECPVGIHLDGAATSLIPDLDQEVWDSGKVQRVASIAMGNHGKWLVQHKPQQTVPMTLRDIAQAVEDVVKADQERAQRKLETKAAREVQNPLEKGTDTKHESSKFTPINSKDCNKHEQRLLGGVIDPGCCLGFVD